MIRHPFGQQSGQHESAGLKTAATLNNFPFCIIVLFQNMYQRRINVQIHTCSNTSIVFQTRGRGQTKLRLRTGNRSQAVKQTNINYLAYHI